MTRVAVTWSGGKDCCLACYEAVSVGHEVTNLLNFIFTDLEKRTEYKFSNLMNYLFTDVGKSTPYKALIFLNYMFHAVEKRFPPRIANVMNFALKRVENSIPQKVSNLLHLAVKNETTMIWHELSPRIVALQAQALEFPIIQREVTWGTFEDEVKATVRKLPPADVQGIVWGIRPPDAPSMDDGRKIGDYIHLNAEKEWVYKVCGDLNAEPIMPLWEKTPEQVLTDLMENGFEVIIVVVNPEFLSEDWLGRRIDQTFLKEIRSLHQNKGVPVGGDDYHTFVLDGPMFKKRVNILKSQKLSRNGYSILDIQDAELISKAN